MPGKDRVAGKEKKMLRSRGVVFPYEKKQSGSKPERNLYEIFDFNRHSWKCFRFGKT